MTTLTKCGLKNEYEVKEWSDLDTIDPNYGIKFKNMIYQDEPVFQEII